ncbi:MAG: flagellar biosynthesis anti-sigma factor FlgM [Christensenellaceae bacterium]|jgi:anti-sigma28 factor (negative regulator of flagellin synthesis)
MKINATTPIGVVEQYKAVRRNIEVAETQSVQQPDKIEFSSDASLFAETLRAAKNSLNERLAGADIDVEGIKVKIASGSYSISSEELAKSIAVLLDE